MLLRSADPVNDGKIILSLRHGSIGAIGGSGGAVDDNLWNLYLATVDNDGVGEPARDGGVEEGSGDGAGGEGLDEAGAARNDDGREEDGADIDGDREKVCKLGGFVWGCPGDQGVCDYRGQRGQEGEEGGQGVGDGRMHVRGFR